MGTTESVLIDAPPSTNEGAVEQSSKSAAASIHKPSRISNNRGGNNRRPHPPKQVKALRGVLVGLPQSGKHTLLKRLKGQDPFLDPTTIPPSDANSDEASHQQRHRRNQQSRAIVPYRAPGKIWDDQLELHVEIIPETWENDELQRVPDFCVMLIDPRHERKLVFEYLLKVIIVMKEFKKDESDFDIPICCLLNFRDLEVDGGTGTTDNNGQKKKTKQKNGSSKRIKESDIVRLVKRELRMEMSQLRLETCSTSLLNCFGLARLHHFFYETYLLRKQQELKIALFQVEAQIRKSEASDGHGSRMTYEDFLKMTTTPTSPTERSKVALERMAPVPATRVSSSSKRPHLTRDDLQSDREEKASREAQQQQHQARQTTRRGMPSAPKQPQYSVTASTPASRKQTLDDFFADDSDNDEEVEASPGRAANASGSDDDDDDDFFLGDATKEQQPPMEQQASPRTPSRSAVLRSSRQRRSLSLPSVQEGEEDEAAPNEDEESQNETVPLSPRPTPASASKDDQKPKGVPRVAAETAFTQDCDGDDHDHGEEEETADVHNSNTRAPRNEVDEEEVEPESTQESSNGQRANREEKDDVENTTTDRSEKDCVEDSNHISDSQKKVNHTDPVANCPNDIDDNGPKRPVAQPKADHGGESDGWSDDDDLDFDDDDGEGDVAVAAAAADAKEEYQEKGKSVGRGSEGMSTDKVQIESKETVSNGNISEEFQGDSGWSDDDLDEAMANNDEGSLGWGEDDIDDDDIAAENNEESPHSPTQQSRPMATVSTAGRKANVNEDYDDDDNDDDDYIVDDAPNDHSAAATTARIKKSQTVDGKTTRQAPIIPTTRGPETVAEEPKPLTTSIGRSGGNDAVLAAIAAAKEQAELQLKERQMELRREKKGNSSGTKGSTKKKKKEKKSKKSSKKQRAQE